MDLVAFDEIAKRVGVGPIASTILSGMRDSYEVDWQHCLATEIRLSLDENCEPTNVGMEIEEFCKDSELPEHYTGTLDGLYLYRDEARIVVDDFKTYPVPFNPDETLQAKMYTVFAMKHFPWAQRVTFRLIFCRYRNLIRAVTFTREDLPKLIEAMKAARARQLAIHAEYEAGKEIEATGGPQCFYCPLLPDGCPIAKFLPAALKTPEEMFSALMFSTAYAAQLRAAMKARVQATGKPIILRDYNEKAFSYGPEEKESNVYPLFQATEDGIAMDPQGNPVMPIAALLRDYAEMPDNEDDRAWLGKLTISSTKLESYLKANKRVYLHQAVSDTAEKVTKVRLKVSKPLDAVDLPEDADEEFEDEEEF